MSDSKPDKKVLDVNPYVFWGASALIFTIVIVSVVATSSVGEVFGAVQEGLVAKFGWFYILSMTGFLAFAGWLVFSPYGDLRLGPDDSRPEFSTPSWFAMLFSAGMGIGLLFFGVAEPLQHYANPPSGRPGTLDSAREAMGLTYFHWGLHPWAVYALIGLAFAYFSFRKGLPLSIRSALYPLLGERVHGRIGDAVDALAVVSTLFGVATSLGYGAAQVNAGLAHVFGIEQSGTIQFIIIGSITLAATVSVVSGLDAGVKRLSELNLGIASLLLIFVFIAGPTAFLLNAFVENLGTYLQHLPENSFWTASFEKPQAERWLSNWTVFYWSWWIAWAPFVGMFIARVSRGRTIREFLLGVMLAPTLVGFLWFTVFGDTALFMEVNGNAGLAEAVATPEGVPTAIFQMLDQLPLATVSSVLCTICVILFFVTSSDSASLVIDTISSGGAEEPPVSQRVYWAVLEGAVAATLVFASGQAGLDALQAAVLSTALPFTLIIIMVCVALYRELRSLDPMLRSNDRFD
jgi:choline/glycine/proline betaine transport protein